MKELSIEEKAKAYDEAINKIMDYRKGNTKMYSDVNKAIDYLFPELAVSEDERIRKELIGYIVKEVGLYPGEDRKEHKWLRWLEKQGEQKPAWSEEDETGLTNTIIMLKEGASLHFNKKDITKALDWLKSLKDRVQPQPKQEWSKEDEQMLNDIIKDLVHPWNEYIPDRIEDEIIWLKNRLKSLRPQSQWKPSDEQMDALRYVTNFDYGGHKATLVSLYEQLKKLKA